MLRSFGPTFGVRLTGSAICLLVCLYAARMRTTLPGRSVSGKATPPAAEQTTFAEDEDIENPVPVPPAVLALILEDDMAKEALETANESVRKDASQCLRAAEVHLAGSGEIDMLVIGSSPMAAADAAWFWVVRSVNQKPQVVLRAAGNTIALLDTRTNGFRDVGTAWASASQSSQSTFRFDGAVYKETDASFSPRSDADDDQDDDDQDDDGQDRGEQRGTTTITLTFPRAHSAT
jgi:hypothetical protein